MLFLSAQSLYYAKLNFKSDFFNLNPDDDIIKTDFD